MEIPEPTLPHQRLAKLMPIVPATISGKPNPQANCQRHLLVLYLVSLRLFKAWLRPLEVCQLLVNAIGTQKHSAGFRLTGAVGGCCEGENTLSP